MPSKRISFIDTARSILSIFVFFLILIILTPIILLLLIFSFGKATNFVMEYLAPMLSWPTFWVAGIDFDIIIHDDEIHEPAVFIFNHSSTVDVLTLLALGIPTVRYVAKWELQYNPFFFLLGRLTGQVFIRRQKSEKAVETLKKSTSRILKNQLSIMMAPEGSRKHPGIIGPFKKGPFRMAMDLNYPIVPIYFEGNRKLSEGGLLLARSGSCRAHIYPPVDTTGWKLEALDEHIASVRKNYLQWAGVD